MTHVPESTPSAALAAFMRGVERRAAVLAELQAGDAAAGDTAVEAALFAFRAEADRRPMSQWPLCFWSGLLANPALQQRVAVAIPLAASDRLAELGNGPRAAVLLRLAAGLTEDEAAQVLGVTVAGYRLALARAVAEDGSGIGQQEAWQRLRDEVQMRIRLLPPPRMSHLARVRESALRGERPAGAATPAAHGADAGPPGTRQARGPARPHVGLRRLLWALLTLCVLAFGATFWWPFPGFDPLGLSKGSWARSAPGVGEVRVEPLGAAEAAASHYDATTALLLHPDFDLLADPRGAEVATAMDFYSWLVADGADTPDPMLPPLEFDQGAGDPPAETPPGPIDDTVQDDAAL
ncbi:sigma-70 region 4 domain-containing protein [Marilutibacter aestuarii]|uniref:RNA polymerase sigma factor 70 region 4 type 2 domain-containing protein n=1 Tax=Marilutibacter aestuarii TaxID=1706195 RepID=A0A507ZWQ2_9GAMM|nr:sigma-70 region 4 domain-containing protein [Lysobacter aestuarii]TQD41949.1 hypothetical protein FKV25_12345 [Lysobacter aestuarii]